MTQRVEGGVMYTQNFDIENRLASVTVNGQTYQYVFDGDGRKVKEIAPDGSYTIYIGDWYEATFNSGGTQTGATSTYYAGLQRVAMRENGTLTYLLTDNLGSSSVALDSAGVVVAEERYYPFGELRDSGWSLSTNFGYTGQRRLEGTGLLDYDARAYSLKLGRFIQADTIVPRPEDPQSLNRYSYVRNNPTRYVDPTGHQDQCYGTDYFVSQSTGDGGISQADCWAIQATVSAIGKTGVDAGGTWYYDEQGGNDELGYKRLTNDKSFIYDLWVKGSGEVYVFEDSTSKHNDNIAKFVSAANDYVQAIEDFKNAQRAGIASGFVAIGGLVAAAAGIAWFAASPLTGPLAILNAPIGVGLTAGGAAVFLGSAYLTYDFWRQMMNAKERQFDDIDTAKEKFYALTVTDVSNGSFAYVVK